MVKRQGSISGANWLEHQATKKLVEILGEDSIRFVGGAVRDTILGLEEKGDIDVDVATHFPPEKVTTLLTKNNIKVIPTGLKHGTVTAVIDKKSYEITTLRHDVETFGRHAKVKFHDNWEEDAKRRDFTLNALYANSKGDVLDYIGGYEDLKAGKIKFIGDAKTRIEEDALRILRFFRFNAYFGKGAMDEKALKACSKLKILLNNLPVERIFLEFIKLISAPNPLPSLKVMEESGILEVILPEVEDVTPLEALISIEADLGDINPIRRFSCLLPKKINSLIEVAKRLKFPNQLLDRLRFLLHLDPAIQIGMDGRTIKQTLFHHGSQIFRDQIILKAGDGDSVALNKTLKKVEDMGVPKFPLRGQDLLARGMAEGQEIGDVLGNLQNKWIESDFVLSREDLLRTLN